MDPSTLLRQYKGDGTSSHHPGTMLRGPGVHLQPADLLVVAFFQSAAGERGLHVAEWEQPAGLPDGQPVPGQGDEGSGGGGVWGCAAALMEEGYINLEHNFLNGSKTESKVNHLPVGVGQ